MTSEPAPDDVTPEAREERQKQPDLLIDFSSIDVNDLKEDFRVSCEPSSQRAMLSPDRIARLIKSTVVYNNWPALIHILSCALVDPSSKRVRIVLGDGLRFLFAATKGRTPRRQPVQDKD